ERDMLPTIGILVALTCEQRVEQLQPLCERQATVAQADELRVDVVKGSVDAELDCRALEILPIVIERDVMRAPATVDDQDLPGRLAAQRAVGDCALAQHLHMLDLD